MSDDTLVLTGRYTRAHPIDDPRGQHEVQLTLDHDRTVLVIVDAYGDYDQPTTDVEPAEGDPLRLYSESTAHNLAVVRDRIVPATAAARAAGIPVVFLTNHLSDYLNDDSEFRSLAIRVHDVDVMDAWSGEAGAKLLGFSELLHPGDGDHLVTKQHYSGFFRTGLEDLLTELGAKNLVMVGFDSNICLRQTAVDAMYRDFRVVVLRDAIATSPHSNGLDPSSEAARWSADLAVQFIEISVGYTASTDAWIDACRRSAESASTT